MSEPHYVFLTGVTGFLGSHVAHRLLQRGYRLGVLVRPSARLGARERVGEALAKVAGLEDGPHQRADRIEVYEGDIAQPGLGLSDDALGRIASRAHEVWHAAASLSFSPEHSDDIFQTNVDGTRHVLDLAERTRRRRVQHVSTAYVAGTRSDLVLESETDVGQAFRNAYEESKLRAELLVRDAHARGAVSATIHRPSIVVGDSTSGHVTHDHGPYAFIRGLWRLRGRLRQRPAAGVTALALRILGAEAATLNFVPIDYVADGMIAIAGQAASVGGTYHLANPHPIENRLWLSRICALLRVEGVRLVDEGSFAKQPMTRPEMIFHKQMAFYRQYLGGEPRFDCRRALDALKRDCIECPRVTVDVIDRMAGRYIESLGRCAEADSLGTNARQERST